MTNLLNNITIIKVTESSDSVNIFSLQYSKNHVCNCFVNYEDEPQGRAMGGGYDKQGVAFAEAVNNVYGINIKNNGEGLPRAISDLEKRGYKVERF